MYLNLRAEMARRNFNISSLAEEINIPVGTLSKKLRGKSNFSIKEAQKIKDALGVNMSIDELFKVEENLWQPSK